jgi:hypothetical protein
MRDNNKDINDVNSNDDIVQEQEMTRRSLAKGVQRRIYSVIQAMKKTKTMMRVSKSKSDQLHVGRMN